MAIGYALYLPSFPGNAFGLTDLNAISFDSSPAFALKREHPTGADYAKYLAHAASVFGLSVDLGVDIERVTIDDEDFVLHTRKGEIRSTFVIWAAGQFQYPDLGEIQGVDHGVHSSRVQSWAHHPGDRIVVIGGYGSGVDAAIGLALAGKNVTVLSRSPIWESNDTDPSIALSPYTRQRLETALRRSSIKLIGDADILGLERQNGSVQVLAADGRSWASYGAPILATGFTGSTSLLDDCFEWDNEGHPLLTPKTNRRRCRACFSSDPRCSTAVTSSASFTNSGNVSRSSRARSPSVNGAVASVFSVIRNVSVPFGIATPNEPNISSTRWQRSHRWWLCLNDRGNPGG